MGRTHSTHSLIRRLVVILLAVAVVSVSLTGISVRAAVADSAVIRTEDGKKYCYVNGKKYKGQIKIRGKWYYFNPDEDGVMATGLTYVKGQKKDCYYDGSGAMQYGQVRIRDAKNRSHWCYFDLVTGAMVRDQIVKVNEKGKIKYCYYDQNGWMVYGQRKIKGYWYYFHLTTGAMKQGFQYIADQDKTVYYDQNGHMLYGLQKIGSKYYYFHKKTGALQKRTFTAAGIKYVPGSKDGVISEVLIQTPALCQRPSLPTGCEIVSWTMMANNAGVKIDKIAAAKEMPRSGNPNYGFVGSPFSSSGGSLVIYPQGLMKMTKKYLGSAEDMTGRGAEAIRSKLRRGHIVMAWVRGLDGFGSHTIAVTGYSSTSIYYNDPWTGTKRSMSWSAFQSMWAGRVCRALSY